MFLRFLCKDILSNDNWITSMCDSYEHYKSCIYCMWIDFHAIMSFLMGEIAKEMASTCINSLLWMWTFNFIDSIHTLNGGLVAQNRC